MKLTAQKRHKTSFRSLGLPLGLSVVALTGCRFDDAEEKGTSSVPLTHSEGHALIQDTINAYSASLEERLRFLDGDTRLIQAFEELFGSMDEDCYLEYSDEGEEFEVCDGDLNDPEDECYVEISDEGEEHIICDGEVYNELAPVPEPDLEPGSEQEVLRIDFMEGTEELTSSLLEELSEELLIADAGQLTYQLTPSELCGLVSSKEDEAQASEPDEGCLELAEREAPRLQLTREADGFKASILVAQGQEELIAVSLTSSLARFSLDLGALSRLLNELASEEEALAINATGAISLEMDTSVAGRATFRFNVDRPISISGRFDEVNEIQFSFPVAQDVFSITSDSSDSSFALRLDVPKLVQSFSASLADTYEFDPETGEDRLVDEGPVRAIVATLGGLDVGLTLRLVNEGVESLLELGLGEESSLIEVDGERVVQLDLNPDHGRLISFNLDRADFERDDLMLAFASELHELKLQLNLLSLPELEMEDWLTDEIFKLALTSAGGELPSLSFESAPEQLRLLTGHLELSAERAGIEHVAEGGQCMMPVGDSEDEEPVMEPASHPFEEMEVGMCRPALR